MGDDTRLGRELAKLEASDPKVAKGLKAYDRMVAEITGRKPLTCRGCGERAFVVGAISNGLCANCEQDDS